MLYNLLSEIKQSKQPYIRTGPHVLAKLLQSFLTRCDSMDCSLPGFSVHGIFQTRILVWVAIPFSRGSSWPRDGTQVSCITGIFFTVWATREAPLDPTRTSKHCAIFLSLIFLEKKNSKKCLKWKQYQKYINNDSKHLCHANTVFSSLHILP